MLNWLKQKSSKQPVKVVVKSLGQMGEEFAQREYIKQGYEIVAANEYNKKGKRLGEIDFIAKNKQRLAFVEVKTRTAGSSKFGSGAEAVDIYKQTKILKAVKVYLLKHSEFSNLKPQIDVCVVEWHEVDKAFSPAIILVNVVEDSF